MEGASCRINRPWETCGLPTAYDTANGKGPKSFSEFLGDVVKAAALGAAGGAAGRGVAKQLTPRNVADDAVAVQAGRGIVGEAAEERSRRWIRQ